MKIAMLIKSFSTTGGAERYVVELSTRLLKRGHEVHLFVQRWDASLIPGFVLHPIRWIRLARYLNSLYYAIQTRRLTGRESFDVIHSHQRTTQHHIQSMHHPCYRMKRTGAGRWGRPFSVIWGLVNPRHLTYRWLERRQFQCQSLTHVIAVSEGTKEDILAHYPIDPACVRVIYPGVDSERMAPERIAPHRNDIRKRHAIKDDDLAIIFVGSEFKRKGLRYAIEALGLIAQDRQVAVKPHLFVLGGGEPDEYLELSERLAIADHVHFIGLYSQVEHYYAAGDICLLPTLSDPFPLVVFEAMACGLPVIVSRQQGVAELLRDGYNALLLENPRDFTQIAKCIVRLEDDRLREQMGRRARETAQTCSWDAMTDQVLALYAESIRQRTETGSVAVTSCAGEYRGRPAS